MKLLGIGDNVVDYYKDQSIMYPGGNALNVAVLCNRINHEQASYIGIVGNDEAADHVLAALRQEHVDIGRVRQAVGENGIAVVALDEDGDRVFVGSNKGGVQAQLGLVLDGQDMIYIRQHDVLHTSVYSHFEHYLPELQPVIDISFDFSTRKEDEYLQKVCPFITYAFFSGSDLTAAQCEQLMEKVHALGTKVVCITRGGEGALLSIDNQLYKQSIIPTEVVDTLGAGDSFIAGFLSAYVKGYDVQAALHEGALLAAQTCGVYGAFGYGKQHTFDEVGVEK